MKNLDLLAAQAAQGIIANTRTKKVKGVDEPIKAGEVDNLVTKALGVLQENGVYAAMLYLYSRTSNDKPIAEQVRLKLIDLETELKLTDPETEEEIQPPEQPDATTVLKFLTDKICNDLDRLLLVKQLWEQTLIYARYGAKARSAAEDKQP